MARGRADVARFRETVRLNTNARLEAFCDAVFAIALTLLIIDIRIPRPESIHSSRDLWHALRLLTPSVSAFLLSFVIILIAWVNHHASFKLITGSSGAFVFANGLLLLAIVFIPFPTSLLGDFVGTDHAAPAVVLYNGVIAIQALGWILVFGSALAGQLVREPHAVSTMRQNLRNAYVALGLYSLLAVLALWFPLTVAIVTTASWIFWLVRGLTMKHG